MVTAGSNPAHPVQVTLTRYEGTAMKPPVFGLSTCPVQETVSELQKDIARNLLWILYNGSGK